MVPVWFEDQMMPEQAALCSKMFGVLMVLVINGDGEYIL
jgi:hypothetical protein